MARKGNVTNRRGTPGYANWLRKTASHRARARESIIAMTHFSEQLERLLRGHRRGKPSAEILEYLCAVADVANPAVDPPPARRRSTKR